MGYLTPDLGFYGVTCRTLLIPDNPEFLANVRGALQQLTFPENWDKFGTMTQQQAADAMLPMFDCFCFKKGRCRVIGEIICYAGVSSPNPANWLLCDGASLERAAYPGLFNAIGATYGAADGTHFNLPDMRGRVVVDVGTGSGLSPRALGDVFGEETHVLSIGEMPSHAHGINSFVLTGTAVPPPLDAGTQIPIPPTSTGNAGGGGAHNNIQPSIVLTYYIVALEGC